MATDSSRIRRKVSEQMRIFVAHRGRVERQRSERWEGIVMALQNDVASVRAAVDRLPEHSKDIDAGKVERARESVKLQHVEQAQDKAEKRWIAALKWALGLITACLLWAGKAIYSATHSP